MALTDTTIKNAKPKATQYKLHDKKGLFAIIRPTGGKLWRFKYRYQGKEQQLSLGTYPEVSLKDARVGCEAARALLAEGRDPSTEKKRAAIAASINAGNTFSRPNGKRFVSGAIMKSITKHTSALRATASRCNS